MHEGKHVIHVIPGNETCERSVPCNVQHGNIRAKKCRRCLLNVVHELRRYKDHTDPRSVVEGLWSLQIFHSLGYSSEVSGLALHKYQKDGYRHRKVIDTLGLQVQYGYRCRKVTGTVMLQIPNGYRHGKDTGTIKVQVQYSCMYCKDTGTVILQIP